MSDGTAFTGGDLTKIFDDKRREVTGETLDHVRQNYFIAAAMNGSDDKSIGGLNINISGRRDSAAVEREKKKDSDQMIMAMISDSLAKLEDELVAKYGEDFAENWAAELLDKDVYAQLMQIKDQDERRHEIAMAIQKGRDDGTIDPASLEAIPELNEWLSAHDMEDKRMLSAENSSSYEDESHRLTSSASEAAALDSIFTNTGPANP